MIQAISERDVGEILHTGKTAQTNTYYLLDDNDHVLGHICCHEFRSPVYWEFDCLKNTGDCLHAAYFKELIRKIEKKYRKTVAIIE